MVKGIVNRIIPFSFVDGPGNRTAIFLQGCNFNCLYCHNPETIDQCNISTDPKAKVMTVGQVIDEIKKVKPFISGITVSGGECTLQPKFLTELFKEVKKLGLTTFIDTNGYIPLKNMKDLLDVTDKAMVDIKSFDNEEHQMLTGKGNATILENVRFLASIDKLFELRTVIVPEVLDNHRNVDGVSKLISELNPQIRYKIIKYRSLGVREDMIDSYSPSDEMMEELYELAKSNGLEDVVLL